MLYLLLLIQSGGFVIVLYFHFWLHFQALLHSVPLGRLVVLDLYAEVKPIWVSSEQFYGIPYIWKVSIPLFYLILMFRSNKWSRFRLTL